MRTLLIDNYDSFTYNLYQLIGEVCGRPPTVVRNDVPWSQLVLEEYDAVVVSPGPGRPDRDRDFGISARAIAESGLPTLGVCLGHQGIAHLFGGSVRHAPEPMHGRASKLRHNGIDLFKGIPSPMSVIRYHSLIVEDTPPDLEEIAWTDEGLVMAVRHRTAPIWGVQFHPESIGTEFGAELMVNFRDLALDSMRQSRVELPARSAVTMKSCVLSNFPDAATLYQECFAETSMSFWLDSSAAIDGVSRYSILGSGEGPLAEFVSYRVSEQTVRVTAPDGREELVQGSIFDYLDRELRARFAEKPDGLPFNFNLGYVGYLGYELKADLFGANAHTSPTADAAMLFVDRAVVIDHTLGNCHVLTLAASGDEAPAELWMDAITQKIESLAESVSASRAPTALSPVPEVFEGCGSLHPRHCKSSYVWRIQRSLQEIRDGEVYQVCLTNEVEVDAETDVLETYLRLRDVSPVPYGALLQFPGVSVLSGSPERFLTIGADRVVESKPIKGTRPRGLTDAEDEHLKLELMHSEKDRAENLMIVDLVRNDLNTVCEVGSVHVPDMMYVESYSAVHQLVSTVRGTLRDQMSAVDCVRAAFPGGSMTGAPKIRAMELIDELENGPRGVYSGALGWFSLCGAADLSIVIRTLVVTERAVTFGVGGAIVALSDPQREYEETVVKSRAILTALAGECAQ
ncbi:aminodeoxychorismate synthase component I [Mycobacterium sp. CBMA271]|uniref:aminodeoxychorismate synthase component I n=1 Tax=unclassified Mycobacteroides TaxID=2618759 RepID=UPI0012DE1331|nr:MULTISPECIES: aminodeoxychorismate synthase component I [unclassified Mycobacteroides]MUM17234.1 aminodeoxychorismate synthase, component I [Mycobacteroides sp. CBMA 326]MUM23936.1 aminodeoxychorismate synthase component I [Mycobacteroides sp. CBMA 271]